MLLQLFSSPQTLELQLTNLIRGIRNYEMFQETIAAEHSKLP